MTTLIWDKHIFDELLTGSHCGSQSVLFRTQYFSLFGQRAKSSLNIYWDLLLLLLQIWIKMELTSLQWNIYVILQIQYIDVLKHQLVSLVSIKKEHHLEHVLLYIQLICNKFIQLILCYRCTGDIQANNYLFYCFSIIGKSKLKLTDHITRTFLSIEFGPYSTMQFLVGG